MIITLTVALFAVLYHLGLARIINSVSETGEQLESLKRTYTDYVQRLERKDEVEAAYKSIEVQFPQTDPDKKPEQQFSEDVFALCGKFGFPSPNIGPPKEDLIENVDDYKFITLTVRVSGKIDRLARLLKEFHKNALLIKEFSLTSVLDDDEITAQVTVARIAKLTEEEIERLEQLRSRRKSASSAASRRFRF